MEIVIKPEEWAVPARVTLTPAWIKKHKAHSLEQADDPINRRIGFVCDKCNELAHLPLTVFKGMKERS